MITDLVKKFINEYINSAVELEILLFFYNNTEKEWTVEDINQELRLSSVGAAQLLAELSSKGLIEVSGKDVLFYKYNPKNNYLGSAIRDLAKAYETHKYTLISLIYSKPNTDLQLFADAFKLKKQEDKKED